MTISLKVAGRKTGDSQGPGKTRQKRHRTKKSKADNARATRARARQKLGPEPQLHTGPVHGIERVGRKRMCARRSHPLSFPEKK